MQQRKAYLNTVANSAVRRPTLYVTETQKGAKGNQGTQKGAKGNQGMICPIAPLVPVQNSADCCSPPTDAERQIRNWHPN